MPWRYLIKRTFHIVIVVFIVTIIIFTLMRLAPGNPAAMMLPETASDDDVREMEIILGLDKPWPVQYFVYISNVLRGDLGLSITWGGGNTSVVQLVGQRFPYTFKLAIYSGLLAIALCIPLGIIAGANRGKPADFFAMFFALVGQSMSPVWLAVLLVYVFSVILGLLPAIGGEGFTAFILPALTIGYPMAAELTRVGRSGMIDTLGEDYITATYARGVSRVTVNWKYAFRNAVCPIITLLGLSLASNLAGTLVVESIFAVPGLGQLMFRSINVRDYPVVQSLMLIFALIYAGINLLVDIVNSIVDPRISLED